MRMYAGFMKRAFAFIIDITLVVVVTWLLYLFPSKLIINKAVDSDYKTNVEKPMDAISEKYHGATSFLGTVTKEGHFTVLSSIRSSGEISSSDLIKQRGKVTEAYRKLIDGANGVLDTYEVDVTTAYDKDASSEDKFYSKVFLMYNYLDFYCVNYAQGVKAVYKGEWTDSKYVLYSSLAGTGIYTESQLKEKEAQYTEALNKDVCDQLTVLAKMLRYYSYLNPDADIFSTQVYTTIGDQLKSLGSIAIGDLDPTVTAEDLAYLKDKITDLYENYLLVVTSPDYLEASGENYKLSNEAYSIFDNTLDFLQKSEELPYYEKFNKHANWAMIYALAMFTLILSVYTLAFRGNTLGRRGMRIKLVSMHEMDKLNPILALLHDVPFRILYLLLIYLLVGDLITLIIVVVLAIVDAVMLRFTKGHRMIRDILSGTKVISAEL